LLQSSERGFHQEADSSSRLASEDTTPDRPFTESNLTTVAGEHFVQCEQLRTLHQSVSVLSGHVHIVISMLGLEGS